jgi:hypothetical protein
LVFVIPVLLFVLLSTKKGLSVSCNIYCSEILAAKYNIQNFTILGLIIRLTFSA